MGASAQALKPKIAIWPVPPPAARNRRARSHRMLLLFGLPIFISTGAVARSDCRRGRGVGHARMPQALSGSHKRVVGNTAAPMQDGMEIYVPGRRHDLRRAAMAAWILAAPLWFDIALLPDPHVARLGFEQKPVQGLAEGIRPTVSAGEDAAGTS